MAFKRAEKRNGKLRLAIGGVSGGGKTYSALLFAKEFGSKIGVIDSERGSASLYADLVPFEVDELEDFTIQEYKQKIDDAAAAGFDVLVIDGLSPSWRTAMSTVDSMGGWAKAGKVVTPALESLVQKILAYPGHVIATVRSKMDYEIEKNTEGKITGMRRIGVNPIARPDSEYDFTIWLDVTREGAFLVSKTRCSALEGNVYRRGSRDEPSDIPKMAATIKAWLSEGAPVSARDALAERIRFAENSEALSALAVELNTLKQSDVEAFKTLRPLYMARKNEFETGGSEE